MPDNPGMDDQHTTGSPEDHTLGAFVRQLDAEIETRTADAPEKTKAIGIVRDIALSATKSHAEHLGTRYLSGDLEARYKAILAVYAPRDTLLEERHVMATLLELLVENTRELRERLTAAAAELEREVEVDGRVVGVLKPIAESSHKLFGVEALAEDDAPG